MVFYSTKSNEKVFHLPHCKIARRIRKEYKKQFATPEEARMAGYRMCNCCSLVGMRLRKEQKAVNQFCQKTQRSKAMKSPAFLNWGCLNSIRRVMATATSCLHSSE